MPAFPYTPSPLQHHPPVSLHLMLEHWRNLSDPPMPRLCLTYRTASSRQSVSCLNWGLFCFLELFSWAYPDYCCHRRLLFSSCFSAHWPSSLVSDVSKQQQQTPKKKLTLNLNFTALYLLLKHYFPRHPSNWPPAPCHWVIPHCTVTGWMIHCWLNSGKQNTESVIGYLYINTRVDTESHIKWHLEQKVMFYIKTSFDIYRQVKSDSGEDLDTYFDSINYTGQHCGYKQWQYFNLERIIK